MGSAAGSAGAVTCTWIWPIETGGTGSGAAGDGAVAGAAAAGSSEASSPCGVGALSVSGRAVCGGGGGTGGAMDSRVPRSVTIVAGGVVGEARRASGSVWAGGSERRGCVSSARDCRWPEGCGSVCARGWPVAVSAGGGDGGALGWGGSVRGCGASVGRFAEGRSGVRGGVVGSSSGRDVAVWRGWGAVAGVLKPVGGVGASGGDISRRCGDGGWRAAALGPGTTGGRCARAMGLRSPRPRGVPAFGAVIGRLRRRVRRGGCGARREALRCWPDPSRTATPGGGPRRRPRPPRPRSRR